MKLSYLKNLLFKAIILSPFIISPAGKMNAQNAAIIKGGMNYSFLGVGFEDGYGDRFAYNFALTGIIKAANNVVVTPEVGYSRRSLDLYTPDYINENYINSDVRLGLNYFDIATHVGYGGLFEAETNDTNSPNSLLVIYAGPQLSLLTGQDNRLLFDDNQIDIPEIDRIQDYIIGLNIGFSFGINNFYFDARYSLPFNSFLQLDSYGDAFHTMSLNVGYIIPIKSKNR